jgi:hypothetical protein
MTSKGIRDGILVTNDLNTTNEQFYHNRNMAQDEEHSKS